MSQSRSCRWAQTSRSSAPRSCKDAILPKHVALPLPSSSFTATWRARPSPPLRAASACWSGQQARTHILSPWHSAREDEGTSARHARRPRVVVRRHRRRCPARLPMEEALRGAVYHSKYTQIREQNFVHASLLLVLSPRLSGCSSRCWWLCWTGRNSSDTAHKQQLLFVSSVLASAVEVTALLCKVCKRYKVGTRLSLLHRRSLTPRARASVFDTQRGDKQPARSWQLLDLRQPFEIRVDRTSASTRETLWVRSQQSGRIPRYCPRAASASASGGRGAGERTDLAHALTRQRASHKGS